MPRIVDRDAATVIAEADVEEAEEAVDIGEIEDRCNHGMVGNLRFWNVRII